jgi:1,4-dihydroxy-2-naphthoate octaprenyltransferase
VATVGLPFVGALAWGVLSVSGAVDSHLPGIAFLPLLALPLAVAPVRTVLSDAAGRALLPVLAGTGRLQLVFGVLLAVALWWWIG